MKVDFLEVILIKTNLIITLEKLNDESFVLIE